MKILFFLPFLMLISCADKNNDTNEFGPDGQRRVEEFSSEELAAAKETCTSLEEYDFSYRELKLYKHSYDFEYEDCAKKISNFKNIEVEFKKDSDDKHYIEVDKKDIKEKYFKEIITNKTSIIAGFCDQVKTNEKVSNTIYLNSKVFLQAKFNKVGSGDFHELQIRRFYTYSDQKRPVIENEWYAKVSSNKVEKQFLGMTTNLRYAQICSDRATYEIKSHSHKSSIKR